MEIKSPNKIVLLGAGNLAWHLGPALQKAGYTLLQVISRSPESAKLLGMHMGVSWTSDAGQAHKDAEILIFCVSDQAIPELFCNVELKKVMMIHTAGSVPAEIFKGVTKEYGVLYPMMTFTKHREMDFRKVPVCVEGSTSRSTTILEKMAAGISDHVMELDSVKRKILHLSGIIASNFSNHMYQMAHDVLQANDLDFNLLKPLILETAGKIMEMDPEKAQTGPASRNDANIIQEHIEMLKNHPELQKIYTFVSDNITNHFRDK